MRAPTHPMAVLAICLIASASQLPAAFLVSEQQRSIAAFTGPDGNACTFIETGDGLYVDTCSASTLVPDAFAAAESSQASLVTNGELAGVFLLSSQAELTGATDAVISGSGNDYFVRFTLTGTETYRLIAQASRVSSGNATVTASITLQDLSGPVYVSQTFTALDATFVLPPGEYEFSAGASSLTFGLPDSLSSAEAELSFRFFTETADVPEPSTVVLATVGLLLVGVHRRARTA